MEYTQLDLSKAVRKYYNARTLKGKMEAYRELCKIHKYFGTVPIVI